jgi:hypothetical protein
VHSTTRYQNFDKRLQPLAKGLRLAAVCISLCLSPAATSLADNPLSTASLMLAWDASASTNVMSYKIYYGTNSGSYPQVVSAGQVTQTTITGFTPGTTYYLAATASDNTGLESAFSTEISFTVPLGQPTLSLSRAGTKSVLKWPTNYSGFTLQWGSSPAGSWTNLTSNPSKSGSNFAYTNTTSTAQRYYRLMK